MTSDEFWCRAFLTAMRGPNRDIDTCERAAHAALAAAQRCGMVTAGASVQPTERLASKIGEFTAKRDGDLWMLISPELAGVITVHSEQLTYPIGGGVVAHIKWSETCPPRPIEVRIVRVDGGER